MVAATSTAVQELDAEERIVLPNVSWSMYVALRDENDSPAIRMTYLEGMLELMSPSQKHEVAGTLLARLLEAWSEEVDLDLRGFGRTTYREEIGRRGLEADESYNLGPTPEDAPPHLAIEVIVSNPLLDKLAVYAGLGVKEVWTWRTASPGVVVHVLVGNRYETASRSRLLPALDLALLASFVRPGENQVALVKAYRAELRARR